MFVVDWNAVFDLHEGRIPPGKCDERARTLAERSLTDIFRQGYFQDVGRCPDMSDGHAVRQFCELAGRVRGVSGGSVSGLLTFTSPNTASVLVNTAATLTTTGGSTAFTAGDNVASTPVAVDGATALSVLDDAGYVGTLATNSEFEVVRYLHLGEVVSSQTVFESISEEKETRMGRGRFVTWVTTYTVASGEVVGRQTFRILKFAPSGARA